MKISKIQKLLILTTLITILTNLLVQGQETIDITLPENKKYYDSIKESLAIQEIKEGQETYKNHQIFKIIKSTLEDKKLVSNLILNELSNENFFEISIEKDYTLNDTMPITDFKMLKKEYNYFDPSEKSFRNFKDLIGDFLKNRNEKFNKETLFYKGNNIHSCMNIEFNTTSKFSLSACTLRERYAKSTFAVGFFANRLEKNMSLYDNCFYFDKFNEIFEIYEFKNPKLDAQIKKNEFIINEKDSKVPKDFYTYMKEAKLIPEYVVDTSNDDSEGGFNIAVRRSVLVIILTGLITTLSFLGLFFFAKSKKKIYEPEAGFEKIRDTE